MLVLYFFPPISRSLSLSLSLTVLISVVVIDVEIQLLVIFIHFSSFSLSSSPFFLLFFLFSLVAFALPRNTTKIQGSNNLLRVWPGRQ